MHKTNFIKHWIKIAFWKMNDEYNEYMRNRISLKLQTAATISQEFDLFYKERARLGVSIS
jgi:hypothetical protein